MADTTNLVKGYHERGLANVLDGAHDLVKRAATLLHNCQISSPPAVSQSYRREAGVCLAEAEELIAAVRKEARI